MPGRLLAGCGQTLRLYDLGQAKLLRKCELKAFPNHIMSLWIAMDKIVLGDIQGSYFMVKHNMADNKYAGYGLLTVLWFKLIDCDLPIAE